MIIGLGYEKQSGKDTVAAHLVGEHGFTRTAFADPLKRGVQEMLGLTDEQLWGDEKQVEDPFWGATPRELLQRIGTDLMREHFDPEVWVKSCYRTIRDPAFDWVVTDVRFPNEAKCIHEAGGYVVRVDRPITHHDTHISELAMSDYDDWDYVLENTGTLADLYTQVDEMYHHLLSL